MFKNLSNKISRSIGRIIYSRRLTENDIKETLDSVRLSLLEGDVALPVVHNFINQVKKNILEQEDTNKYLTSGQALVKMMHSCLVKIMKDGNSNELNLNICNPTVILIVGTQGSGKTTTTGKLAKFLSVKKHKKVLVLSVDMYRPSGVNQLKILVDNITGVSFFLDQVNGNVYDIIRKAISYSKLRCYDVLLIDTAGCLDTDDLQLSELVKIHKVADPVETLFVVDSMMGQASMNCVTVFSKKLPLTGVILTKLDGDPRSGVALSIKYITDKSIKFIGTGESIDALEPFYPDRIAGLILGMGDVLSLVENIENNISSLKENKQQYTTKDIENYNLNDFLIHIKQIQNIGGVDKIINKLPNFIIQLDTIRPYLQNNMFVRMEAIINSMTIKERINPDIITKSIKKRIAYGAGVNVKDINILLTQFNRMRITINQLRNNGLFNAVRTLKNKISSSFMMR